MLRSEETVTRALPTPLWTKNDMDDIFSAHVGPIPRVRLVNQTNTVNLKKYILKTNWIFKQIYLVVKILKQI